MKFDQFLTLLFLLALMGLPVLWVILFGGELSSGIRSWR